MKKFLTSAAFVFAAILCSAQMPEQLPIDASYRTGKLENGLTYYIRQNAKPANRAEFYLATNVGAIQETPDQDGLAHFLEHMCFNGTKNFPDKGILNWLESIGASFGGNVNASTGVEQTIYLLNNIPLIRPTVVDTCLLIMHDYSHFVSCLPEEIEKERGVILEEKRTRNNAGWRFFEKKQPFYYGDSKYNGCTIIGSAENLKTFKPESLTNFYHSWYRPDMQALIVVGDINVDEVEAKIKSTFADIEAPVNPKQKDVITIPDNVEPLIGVLTDPEADSHSFEVLWKKAAMPEELNNTIVGVMREAFDFIVRSAIMERFEDIRTRPDAPFVSADCGIGSLCETADVLQIVANFEEGKGPATLETLLMVAKGLKTYGILDDEFERAKAKLLSYLENSAKSADTRKNSEFVYPAINHFFDNKTLLDPQTGYELTQQLMTMISTDAVNQYAKELVTDHNMVVIYTGPEKGQVPAEEEITAIITKVKESEIEAPQTEDIPEALLDASAIKDGTIKKAQSYIYGSEILTLSNGMKVVLYPTDKVKDDIRIELFKLGGRTLIEDKDICSFDNYVWGTFLQNSGVSEFSLKTLKKMLASKIVSAAPYINETSHGINAQSSTKDFETALQLVYLLMTDPRFDKEEYEQGIKQIQAFLPNLINTPDYALQKAVYETLYNNDRRLLTSDEVLAKANLETVEKVYRQIFCNGAKGSYAIIVGDFDIETAKGLVCKYLGGIPKGKGGNKVINRNDWIVDGKRVNDFQTAMKTPKVTCFDIYKTNKSYSMESEVSAMALSYILNMLYTETLREDEGGTYGASVISQVARKPYNAILLQVAYETNNELADKLRGLVDQGIEGIATDGPRPEMYEKTVKNLEKRLPENLEKLGYWQTCLREYILFGNDRIAEYEAAVKALTPEKIKATAAEFLSSGNRAEIIMRPE